MAGILGIIPARAGSVGVPRKNIRLLAGIPLVAHTIKAAVTSRIDRVVVSTDSKEIMDIAVKFNAECPFLRPTHLATSSSLAIEVVRHTLDHYWLVEKWRPDAVFYLQPTSPFRTNSDINSALDLFRSDTSVDSVMSISLVNEHPSFQWIDSPTGLTIAFPDLPRPQNRQDLIPIYIDNNAIILSRTSYLLGDKSADLTLINYENFIPMRISGNMAIDIDTEIQFKLAEVLSQS